jgi:hypothetical protein
VIPAERYKSDHVHVVPLVDEAAKILSHVLTTSAGRSGFHFQWHRRQEADRGVAESAGAHDACGLRSQRRPHHGTLDAT